MRLRTICLSAVLGLSIASCGPYEKMRKSRDHEAKYRYALELYQLRKDNKAISMFEDIAPIFSGTDKIDTIKFYTAKSYYRQGNYIISAAALDEFRKAYTRSPFAEEAEYLYAMSNYEVAPNPELDQTYTHIAISAFDEYIARYSDNPKVQTCLELKEELSDRLYTKAFLVAKNYYDIGYYNSAITEFKNVLKEYPSIDTKERIQYLLVKANYEYARSSVETKQRERYYNTIDAYLTFSSQFPESEYMNEATKMYNNAQSLAKGFDAIEDVAKELDLSDKKTVKGSKKYVELSDKVASGKLTKEEAQIEGDKLIERSKRRASRKGYKGHTQDSIARQEAQIKELEEKAMREQGLIPELGKVEKESRKSRKEKESQQENEVVVTKED